jgi:hypothetical protein
MARWNKPPALGLQLDRCDVCGDKYHRRDLVLTQVEFLDMEAENAFTHSSYHTDLWTMDTASDVTSSTVATYGNRCDNVRLSLDDDNNLTYLNSPKVWEGSGTLYMNTDSGYINENTDLVVSAQAGPHEQNTSPEMTVVIGVCNDDASSKSAIQTLTIAGTTRVWAYSTVADLVATGLARDSLVVSGVTYYSWRYYFQITNTGKWWIDEMQYEAGTSVTSGSGSAGPGNFVRTAGTKVTAANHPQQSMVTSRKVCPGCRELVLSKSEQYGRTDESPVDEPVETWAQEF